jgi:hypothetical protein
MVRSLAAKQSRTYPSPEAPKATPGVSASPVSRTRSDVNSVLLRRPSIVKNA